MAILKIGYQNITNSIRFLFILLFVYAATSKLLIYEQFTMQLGKSPFIGNYANILAWVIPLVEYIIVGLFLFPRYFRAAFYASFYTLILFTLYIILVLNFSASIPCSCGGIISKLGWTEHLVFNLLFIVLSLTGILFMKKYKNNSY
ncbi:hypothetical protein MWU65_04120 [Cellulophaga sp. F20128]|uniref:MauE/DoxX family redox-associated membrane protein n=1 Tax=Cellulophaga sp. F20128 TaxID=2926413 RepID=UPI001FF6CAEB|nr:MauE/DoxX family redox-associated membrane protein [Cellulophaga sp. F20128]MCK0156352.1 hypothetical protein [Cellulophaga sp. F20128]